MDGDCAQDLRALRELLDERDKAHAREHGMLREAIEKAEQGVNLRLEGMNELRAQINAERGSYLTTSTYDAKHEALTQKLDQAERTLAGRIATLEQQSANTSGRFWALGVGLTLMVIAINVALHFVK